MIKIWSLWKRVFVQEKTWLTDDWFNTREFLNLLLKATAFQNNYSDKVTQSLSSLVMKCMLSLKQRKVISTAWNSGNVLIYLNFKRLDVNTNPSNPIIWFSTVLRVQFIQTGMHSRWVFKTFKTTCWLCLLPITNRPVMIIMISPQRNNIKLNVILFFQITILSIVFTYISKTSQCYILFKTVFLYF